MTVSAEQRRNVDKIIDLVAEKTRVERGEARTKLHKYVCGGKCSWYKTRSRDAGFDRLDLPERGKVEAIVATVMKSLSGEEAKWQIP
jgi:hypothetical protein